MRRQAARAAAQIHEQLTRVNIGSRWIELPQEAWNEAGLIIGRLRLALARGWNTAARTLLLDLEYVTRQVCQELNRFQSDLPEAPAADKVARSHEIAKDLVALYEEFHEVTVDTQNKIISVVTESIELEGVTLGRFRIELAWREIGTKSAYEVVALKPCAASENEAVTHPHVQGQRLCEGDGAAALRAALTEGRLLDFFMLANQILQTYNADSAYIPLERWLGIGCRDCGSLMSAGDQALCEVCEDPLCDECSASCQDCGKTLCGGCLNRCAECDQFCCEDCLSAEGNLPQFLCQTCFDKRPPHPKEDLHAIHQSSPADCASAGVEAAPGEPSAALAVDPLCLGQTPLSS